jgi:putative two-component system response regulator
MAQSYWHLEIFDRGFEVVQKALSISKSPADANEAFEMCLRELTYVQLALEVGALKSAQEHAKACRHHSQWSASAKSRVFADIADGLCEIQCGDVERGFAFLDSSLLHSSDFALKIDALTALASAHGEVGNAEKALHYIRELLKTVREAREQSIRALMAISKDSDSPFVANPNDMRPLELREARLETKVAKREVLHSRLEMLERLAIAADLKEEDSGEHVYRVGRLSALFAADLGWEPDACAGLEMAARLHDIGKVGVPDRILFNSDKLKDVEREFIATHTMIGSEMLSRSDIPHLRIAQEIALHHHEWWNGEGYPSKLHGKRIPLHARIVALADVFDALTHGRPYSPPWSMEDALAEIGRRRGTQFDPELTDRFLALVEKLIRQQVDLDDYLGKAGRNSPFLQARTKIRRLLAEKHENEAKSAFQDSEIHV